jgi:hypothetical protein
MAGQCRSGLRAPLPSESASETTPGGLQEAGLREDRNRRAGTHSTQGTAVPRRARWHGHDRAGCCSGMVLWSYRRMVQAQCSYCMNDTGARSFALNLGPPCFLSGCDPCPSFWADRPLACGFTVVSPIERAEGWAGSPRFKDAVWPVSKDLACCNLRISESIASTMPVMFMTHCTAMFEVRAGYPSPGP